MRKPHKQIKIHSQIDRFLNEEGLSNIMIADFLNISTVTLKKYMMNPKLLRVENIFDICNYTNLSVDFIISLIEDN